MAEIVERRPDEGLERFAFRVPDELARAIAPKGSVALDGVSLTVNEVEGTRFGVNIIPHTHADTDLRRTLRSATGSISRSTCWRATSRACVGPSLIGHHEAT